jgi:hypothetical protein
VVGAVPGPRRDHVAVADRLDLLDAVAVDELVEAREQPIQESTTSRASRRLDIGVKSTTSAKRMLTWSKWSAMVLGSRWSRSATSPGKDVQQERLDPLLRRVPPRAKVTSRSIATNETRRC